jgi:Uri superfamily endonuclease
VYRCLVEIGQEKRGSGFICYDREPRAILSGVPIAYFNVRMRRMVQAYPLPYREGDTCYQLLFRLKQVRDIRVGRLGRFSFQAGYYIYTGSAKRCLSARVARHLKKEKRLHWHIDYLLQYADIVSVTTFGAEVLECELAERALSLPVADVPAPRFGASDCRCMSHLVYVGNEPACKRA